MSFFVRPFQIKNLAALPDSQLPPENFLRSARPLDLEIGCGVGWHPIAYARKNPDRDLIAIEHTRAKFEKFRSRLARHAPIPNLLPVHADAVSWATLALPSASVEKIFILYPNPEPKATSQRWIRRPFMHRLLQILKPNGELIIATNEPSYISEVLDWAQGAWSLEVLETRKFGLAEAPAGIPRTHFEKKYLVRGEICFDVRLRRPSHG